MRPLVGLALLLLTLGGCSSYEPRIAAGATPPAGGYPWIMWIVLTIVITACVAFLFRDGIWSNTIRLVNVIFAGLLAMNFFEPVAKYITDWSASLHPYTLFFDFLSLWSCFIFFMVVFLAATDKLSRVSVRFPQIIDRTVGGVLSLCIGWIMAGFVLMSLHAAPLAEHALLGGFQPQSSMFFGVFAPDREWLGFTKYQSSGPYFSSVTAAQPPHCEFPDDFIKKQDERRKMLEEYVKTTKGFLVNPHMITTPKPAAKKTRH